MDLLNRQAHAYRLSWRRRGGCLAGKWCTRPDEAIGVERHARSSMRRASASVPSLASATLARSSATALAAAAHRGERLPVLAACRADRAVGRAPGDALPPRAYVSGRARGPRPGSRFTPEEETAFASSLWHRLSGPSTPSAPRAAGMCMASRREQRRRVTQADGHRARCPYGPFWYTRTVFRYTHCYPLIPRGSAACRTSPLIPSAGFSWSN